MPIGFICFFADGQAWVKAVVGLSEAQSQTLARGVIQVEMQAMKPFVVKDIHLDPRYGGNRELHKAGIRSLAGIPLVTPEGILLGCIGIADHAPRRLEVQSLRQLTECGETAQIFEYDTPRGTAFDFFA